MTGVLAGKVCLVTGASRGIGKGIALQLGEAGATVYITGRTLKPGSAEYPGSLQETAEEVEKRGGKCIPVQCDHSDDAQIKKLFERVAQEQDGRLDILINNVYSAVPTLTSNVKTSFWELPPEMWDEVNVVGLRNHYICAVYGARLMIPNKRGLMINISSVGAVEHLFTVPYGTGKAGCDKMMVDCAVELRPHNIACVSLWPGPVKTEIITDSLTKGKFDADDRLLRGFENGESIEYPGKCIVHLATDPNIMKKSGYILWTGELADEYGFKDVDGKEPPNYRRVKHVLQALGHPWIACFVPRFLKLPAWTLAIAFHKFY